MAGYYIQIISGSEVAKVKISDVLMVERDRRRLHIVTAMKDYRYYEKMDNITGLLDDGFFPCLKGCYINFARVASMSEQRIYFDNGRTYDMGRSNFIKTKQLYKDYLKNTI